VRTSRDQLIDKALATFAERITDRVFLMIQNDPHLKREYDCLLAGGASKHGLNALFGKRIREYFGLRNAGRSDGSESGLIDSYERHVK
jgi:hypothetical protein